MMTLDGFFEGPNRDIGWHNVDAEFNDFAIEQLDSMDLILFGRVTYELMASYWPAESAIKDDPVVASKMNSISKIVFSKSLREAVWNNTRLVRENTTDVIRDLKKQPGEDIGVFGSADLVSFLMREKLIDQFRIIINPVILGGGNPLFKSGVSIPKLKLVRTRTFTSGNVLLYYEPAT